MKKIIVLIACIALSLSANAQAWMNVGNTLQRQTNGTYSNFRFNMGSPGFFSLYSKAQTDSLVSIITGGYLKWSDTTNSIQTIQNLNPRIAAFGDQRYVKYTGATADLDLVSTGKGLYSEFIEAGHAGGTGAGLLASYFYNDNLTGRGIGIAAGDATHEALYIQPYNLGAKTIQLFGDGHAVFAGGVTADTVNSNRYKFIDGGNLTYSSLNTFPVYSRTAASVVNFNGTTNQDFGVNLAGTGMFRVSGGWGIQLIPNPTPAGPDFGTDIGGIAYRSPTESMTKNFLLMRMGQYLFEDDGANWMFRLTPTGANFGSPADLTSVPQSALEVYGNMAIGRNVVQVNAAPVDGLLVQGSIFGGYLSDPGTNSGLAIKKRGWFGAQLDVDANEPGTQAIAAINSSTTGYGGYVQGGNSSNYALKIVGQSGGDAMAVYGDGHADIFGHVSVNGTASGNDPVNPVDFETLQHSGATYVPKTRTINGFDGTANINLSLQDVYNAGQSIQIAPSTPFVIKAASTADGIQLRGRSVDNQGYFQVTDNAGTTVYGGFHGSSSGINADGNWNFLGNISATLPTYSSGTNLLSVYNSTNNRFETTTALPNGVTAITQSAGDNSTKVATTAYVDAVSAIKLASFYIDVAATTTAADAYSYTLAANSLTTNGQYLDGEYAANFTGGTGTGSEVILSFGGTTIYDTGLYLGTGVNPIGFKLIRSGTTTARCIVSKQDVSGIITDTIVDLTGLDFTTTNVIKANIVTSTGNTLTMKAAKLLIYK